MISNFIKLTLVNLMLTAGLLPQFSSGQTPDLPNPTPEQITAYIELVQDYIRQTKPEFEEVFKLKLSELGESYDSHGYRSYLHTLKMIEEQAQLPEDSELKDPRFLDPALKPGFNSAYNGNVNTTFSYGDGEVALAWADNQPITISSQPETFQRTMYVPEGLDLTKKDIKRLIYNLHVFDGNNGFGISDLVKISSKDSILKRAMKSVRRFRKKHFVRGVDVKIVTVNSKGIVVKSEVSKKPRYLSARYFKEYFGAMNHGRNVTKAKLVKAAMFGSISGGLSLAFTNLEMATVMVGLTVSSQLFYEGYLAFKYSNSRLMQIVKQTALIAFTGTMYTLLHYGLSAGEQAWTDMVMNTLKSSAIFFTASYAKQLLLESGLTKKDFTLIPSFKSKQKNKVKGKEIKFLGRTYFMPNKISFNGVTLNAARTHDFVFDAMISIGRQLDLVLHIPYLIPGIFAGLHTYSAMIYKYIKKKNLTSPTTEMISKEVFYRGYIKKAALGLNKAGAKFSKNCNALLSNKVF